MVSYNPYRIALDQFEQAAGLLELDQASRDLLRLPLRELHFSIPVRLDDGRVRVFRGSRVQHNDARGPGKGGVRFHPQETVDTVLDQFDESSGEPNILSKDLSALRVVPRPHLSGIVILFVLWGHRATDLANSRSLL